MADNEVRIVRNTVPEPPKGWARAKAMGPGLLWMISSVGSGSLLFTPRVGSRYEYALLWIALCVIFFMWIMIREVGRYTVITGRTILDGFSDLPGPKGWAIWLIFLPQLLGAVVTIAGIAALTGSALMIALPGELLLYAYIIMLLSIVLVASGSYQRVENASSVMSGILIAIVLVTVVKVFPSFSKIGTGLVPSIPNDFDAQFALPWLGFILAGAAGILWFSYWVSAKGYGGKVQGADDTISIGTDTDRDEQRAHRLKRWMNVMSSTAAVGVIGGGLIIVSFLILGSELLAPKGIVPKGIKVAEDLTRLLSDVWGQAGFWMLIVAIVVALAGTVLADQDGWARMFTDATLLLSKKSSSNQDKKSRFNRWSRSRGKIHKGYAIVICTAIPALLLAFNSNPVKILSIAGIVAAAHTPAVVFLTWYINRRSLPKNYQPGIFVTASLFAAGLFFLGFAVYHFSTLVTGAS